MGFKVDGNLKHKGATPPAGIVVKHPKQHCNRVDIVLDMCFLGTDTPHSQCPMKKCFKGDFLNLESKNRSKCGL